MDERFGDWMRDALADIDEDVLKRRWVGVEALAGSLEGEEVLDLLLYSTGCGTHNDATLEKVRRSFWECDNAFRMQGNDLELRRLCGAVLIHVLQKESEHQVNAALACICVQFGGSLDEYGWSVLLQEAETTLQDLSAKVRSNDMIERNVARTVLSSKASARVKQLKDERYEYMPIDDLSQILSQFTRAINQIGKDRVELHSALALQKEENDILWWLVGGYSNDLKQPFEGMKGAVAATVAGKELADHVIHLPGPLSVINILNRVLKGTKENKVAISLESLVPELPMQWRKELVAETTDRVLRYCPLMAAISHCVTMEDDASWTTPFSKQFPHDTTLDILPDVLAYQMYRERMLLLNLS